MSQATGQIRNHESFGANAWPVLTRAVSCIGRACVIEGLADFGPEDLLVVRRRFPDRRVTLDGDVITVWPPFPPVR